VTLLGADGRLGPVVLNALVSSGFIVQVMKRQSSKSHSNYPPGIQEIRVPDDFPEPALELALRGQDAIVITIPGAETELQKKLANAAVRAGVQRFIPADFGSCDSDSENAQKLVPLYVEKWKLRKYLGTLAAENKSFSWTALVCGHFFDYDPHFLHIDLKERKADFLDEGEVKSSASTLKRIGEATAKILEKADDERTKDRTLYVQSFCVSQKEVLEAFEKATGDTWTVRNFDSAKFIKEQKEKMEMGSREATEEVVWVLGTLEANWEKMPTFANGLLGLEEESLDDVVKAMVAKGWAAKLR